MKSVYNTGEKKFCFVHQKNNLLYEFLPFGYSCYDLTKYKGCVKTLLDNEEYGFIHEQNYKGPDETRPSFVYISAREEHCKYQEATGIYESFDEEIVGLDANIKSCIRDSTLNSILD